MCGYTSPAHDRFLLKHHFVPSMNYHFPSRVINQRQRHFQNSWLDKYAGLVYSKSEDGGYCKYCVLFGRCESSVKELGVLVNRPLTNFKKASEKLAEHCAKSQKSHHDAMEKAMTSSETRFCREFEMRNSSLSLRMRQPMQQAMSNCPSVFVLWRMVCH